MRRAAGFGASGGAHIAVLVPFAHELLDVDLPLQQQLSESHVDPARLFHLCDLRVIRRRQRLRLKRRLRRRHRDNVGKRGGVAGARVGREGSRESVEWARVGSAGARSDTRRLHDGYMTVTWRLHDVGGDMTRVGSACARSATRL